MEKKLHIFDGGIKQTGPGKWHDIHLKSYLATTDELKRQFVWFMKNEIQPYLNCEECQKHCLEYLNENKIEEYFNVKDSGRDMGMFVWSWKFHNTVNKRLGKKEIPLNVAYDYFKNFHNYVCSKDCDEGSKYKKYKRDSSE